MDVCLICFAARAALLASVGFEGMEWTHNVDTLTIEMFFDETMSNSPSPTDSGLRVVVDGNSEDISSPLTVSGQSVSVVLEDISSPPTTLTLAYDGTQANFKSATGKPVWVIPTTTVPEGS